MGREGSRQSGVDKGRARARLYARLGRRRRRPRAGGIGHGGIGSPGASRSVSMTEFPPVLRVTGPRGADSGPGGSGPRQPTSGLRSGDPPPNAAPASGDTIASSWGFPAGRNVPPPRPQWNSPRPSPGERLPRHPPVPPQRPGARAPHSRRPVPGGCRHSLLCPVPLRMGSPGFSRIPGAPQPALPERGGLELGRVEGLLEITGRRLHL